MKRTLYLASSDTAMNYPIVYRDLDMAYAMYGVKRIIKVMVDIPEIEETIVIAENVL